MRGWTARQVAIFCVSGLSLIWASACSVAPGTVTPEEFFRGKTIAWVISSDPGSSTDVISRAVGPFLAKATGATVRPENYGNQVGLNYTYTEAKPDGLTVVSNVSNGIITSDMVKSPGILYEADKFNYVADVNPSRKILQVSPKLPYKTLDALQQAKGLKAGATTAKGALAIDNAVALEILGIDGKVISGFKGTGEMRVALERGEIDLIVSSDSRATQLEADGVLVNVVAWAENRSQIATNVPTVLELGVKIPKELATAFNYTAISGTAVALPPGVAEDRIEYLRQVFQRLREDTALQNEMQRVNEVWRPFMSGKELQDKVAAIKADKALAEQLDTIFAKHSVAQ